MIQIKRRIFEEGGKYRERWKEVYGDLPENVFWRGSAIKTELLAASPRLLLQLRLDGEKLYNAASTHNPLNSNYPSIDSYW